MGNKRRPDGSKNRRNKRRAPRAPFLPVAPGYERKDSGHIVSDTSSIAEFVIECLSRLGDFALTELFEQVEGDFSRPFNSHGTASTDYNASYYFSIAGAYEQDEDFHTWLEEIRREEGIYSESSLEGLPLTFGERIGELAIEAERVITEQLDAELLREFTVGCFVRVTDRPLLIHLKVEQRPPAPFPDNVPNDPNLS